MTFEDKSRNTWENAIFTRDLVNPKPGDTWLLVTSAWHMPRAMGIFRKAGFKVTAYPVDYLTYGNSRDLHPPRLALDEMERLENALHEWIGLVAYRLTDKTDALFPAPLRASARPPRRGEGSRRSFSVRSAISSNGMISTPIPPSRFISAARFFPKKIRSSSSSMPRSSLPRPFSRVPSAAFSSAISPTVMADAPR